MRYDILEKLGEGNKGEVYKVKLENGKIAALKWAKNYEIEKEWEILNYLDGFYAPKPIKRGNKYFIMELIEGKALKEFLDTPQYYYIIQKALIGAYELDLRKVTHSQLGRFFHIIYNEDKKDIKFKKKDWQLPWFEEADKTLELTSVPVVGNSINYENSYIRLNETFGGLKSGFFTQFHQIKIYKT